MAKPIAVYSTKGQSNNSGRGNGALSPTVDPAMAFQWKAGLLIPCNDPVGSAVPMAGATIGGSAWPSFVWTYNSLRGEAVCIVPNAIGGSGLCQAENPTGYWDNGGTLTPAAITNINDAMTVLTAAGWSPYFAGTLWCQGEAAAVAYDNGLITAPDYGAALSRLIATIHTAFPGSPFYTFRLGTRGTGGDTAGWTAIRNRQEENTSTFRNAFNMRMVFRGAKFFPSVGLMGDGDHYSQHGYNVMGRYGAIGVVNDGIISTQIISENTYPVARGVFNTD